MRSFFTIYKSSVCMLLAITAFMKVQAQFPAYATVYTNLMIAAPDSLVLADGIATAFDNRFSANVDANDALKFWNSYENIAEVRNNNMLSIEFRPVPKLTDTIFYKLYLRQMPYALKVFAKNLTPDLAAAWLIDKYLNTQTRVNLYDTTIYNFTPTSDTNTYRNRFMLVFRRQLYANPVAVTKSLNTTDPNSSGFSTSMIGTEGTVNVYPNPATTGKAMLKFYEIAKGDYEITVYNSRGKEVVSHKIQHDGSNKTYPLSLNAFCSAGIYTINVADEDLKKTINLQLLISK